MPIHEYPFVVLQKGSMPRPMLPIRIVNPDTGIAIPAWELIDTGADDCAIPAKYASMLGHNFQSGRERRVGTGNGVTIAYAHTTNIEILKVEGDTVFENIVVENVDSYAYRLYAEFGHYFVGCRQRFEPVCSRN